MTDSLSCSFGHGGGLFAWFAALGRRKGRESWNSGAGCDGDGAERGKWFVCAAFFPRPFLTRHVRLSGFENEGRRPREGGLEEEERTGENGRENGTKKIRAS